MKIGQIYNTDSIKGFIDSAKDFSDSSAGVVLARNLTHVDPRIFEKKYPELTFMNSGISVDNSGGYASRVQSLRLVDQGDFSINNDKDGNKGKISLLGEDNFLDIKNLEAQSEWSKTEIQTAKLQNVNLPARFLATHNKVYMRTVDEIGLIGHEETSGLLNSPDFVTDVAADVITNLNSQEMYDAICNLITDQNDAVNNTAEYKTNCVMMPTRVYNRLKKQMLDTANGSNTVLRALMDNFPEVKFYDSFRADTIANGGSLPVSSVVAYNNSSEAMLFRIPQPLEIGKVIEISSFRYHVESRARVAGLDVLEATAGRILNGL